MKYVATINGKRYEVEVEKVDAYKSLDRNGAAAPKAPVLAATHAARPAAPAPAPAAAPAPAPAVAPAPAAAPAPAPAAAGGTTVEAPMPGKILTVKASVGQAVKFGEPLVIMEAMKMETEIVAPADGTVSQVLVNTGDTVDTGAAMVILN